MKRILAIRLVEKKMFTILVGMVLALSGLYGYFVSKSVVDVLVRGEIEQEIGLLHSRIGELEFSYITKKERIDFALAQSLGLVEVREKQFVTRRSALSHSLTLSGSNRVR